MSKLLIVDDEIEMREAAKRFFSRRNIDVMTASGGKDALKIIDEQKPNLVLLDVHMAEMTGIDVLKKLRAQGNKIKVIMVSGETDPDVINEANKCGVRSFIHKPLILEDLGRAVIEELNNV